jgi:hypothetical protein
MSGSSSTRKILGFMPDTVFPVMTIAMGLLVDGGAVDY